MKKLLAMAVLGGVATAAFGQNLLVNPGFETGDMTGWTLVHQGSFSGVSNSTTWPPHSGSWAFHMGAVSATDQSDFYQDVATVVGQTYNVSFWAFDQSNPGTGFIHVTFGGQDVGPVSGTVASTYTQYSANFVATSTTTRLEATGWESAQYVVSDDYSVQAVPEPASMAALGLGALALLRRRRKA